MMAIDCVMDTYSIAAESDSTFTRNIVPTISVEPLNMNQPHMAIQGRGNALPPLGNATLLRAVFPE
jgi:hypothetical protein